MQDLLNSIDVLVLPSINEGLPLITVEALACGANVVGSRVGGIPESIGEDNAFALGDSFVDAISDRIVEMLENSVVQPLSPVFYSDTIAEIENKGYCDILG